LRWLEGIIRDQPDAELRKMMKRNRLEMQTALVSALRTAYAAPPKEPT
jgi:hypothetical protein